MSIVNISSEAPAIFQSKCVDGTRRLFRILPDHRRGITRNDEQVAAGEKGDQSIRCGFDRYLYLMAAREPAPRTLPPLENTATTIFTTAYHRRSSAIDRKASAIPHR